MEQAGAERRAAMQGVATGLRSGDTARRQGGNDRSVAGHQARSEIVWPDPGPGGSRRIESQLPYPFWVRASAGSSGLGSLLVADSESLASWVKINKSVESFLCSEYLPGRNFACKLLYFDGDLVRSACAERVHYIMAKVAPSGVTGNTAFGRFFNESRQWMSPSRQWTDCSSIPASTSMGSLPWTSRRTQGRAKITEVNVRNVAFNGCFAQLGANFSEDVVRLLTKNPEFDAEYRQYKFDDDYVFISDVDVEPIVLRCSELLPGNGQSS